MRIVIVRTMPNFSMDVYADGIAAGLRAVRPDWEVIELAPLPLDRTSRSLFLRAKKFYERFWNFPRTIRQQKADIFHIIDHSEAHIVYGLKKVRKPVVVTCHDLINFFYRDNLRGSVKVPFVSNGMWMYSVRGLQDCDHVVTVSAVTAKDTAQILNVEPARISVVPNAVEPGFRPLPKHESESFRQQQGISPETICLLNVGSNHPRKNISAILRGLAILRQKGLPVLFWKAGADFDSEQKTFIQTEGLESHITYLGNPDKSTLVQLYNAANILVAPSLHEGFGMTLLEAMACGTPAITANVSAMPEVVGDAGVLVDPQDWEAIANAVCRLHNDPGFYQELVNKGLERVKAFTWENTAEQIAEIYEKLLKESPRL
ncbi:MAG: glycosyltransferase family 4 protein [Leptolyngbyaceae cyanobacterium SM1_4_3]|nr:glycosyltransferase family 4 protein [Leptolyngbyaceae cyanobacterium SM1_4_3]